MLESGKILIPEIKEKIEQKLNDLGLKPKISPKKFLEIHKKEKHRYFSPCKKEGKIFGFYARLHNNLDAKKKFITEIRFLKKLKNANFEIKDIVPEIINYGIEDSFEWYLRKYSNNPPLGHSRNLTQKPFPGMIKKIVEAIFNISKIPPKTFPRIKRFDFKNYFALKVYESLVRKKIISKDLSGKIAKLIKENSDLLKNENKYFSHGDLNLGNILSDGKEILIIDWELIHLNNFAYDIGYLWAHLWEAKKPFRRKLIKAYFQKLNKKKFSKFKILFPIVVSYFSLGGIEYKKKGEEIKILKKRRKFYLKVLKNCLDFDKLVKL